MKNSFSSVSFGVQSRASLGFYWMLICIIFLLSIIYPAQAFTADTLTIKISQNGDAEITFDYTLTLMEQVAVYLRIADPHAELKKALESNFHRPVTIQEVTDRSSKFRVEGLATCTQLNGTTVLSTPAISFAMAEKFLKKYWFAPLVNPDYSPGITRIIYPDGYSEEFTDMISIPKTSHAW